MSPQEPPAPNRDLTPLAATERREVYEGGRPHLGPALVVIAIALAISAAGAILGFVGSSGSSPGSARRGVLIKGTSLRAESATSAFKPVTKAGEPPTDVLSAVDVPSDSHVTHVRTLGGGLELYDAAVYLSVPDPTKTVVKFFRAALGAAGWGQRTSALTTDGKGSELFGRRASSDGFYWEVGIVVRPASSSLSPALGGAAAAPTSTVEVRVFEVNDAS